MQVILVITENDILRMATLSKLEIKEEEMALYKKEMEAMLQFAEKIEADMTYTRTHPTEDIAKAFLAAAGRGKSKLPPPREAFSGIVERKIVSVSSRVVYVLRQLWDGTPIKYRSLFKDGSPKSELVATFLAVLELVKNSRIRIDGDGDTADVKLLRKDKTVE